MVHRLTFVLLLVACGPAIEEAPSSAFRSIQLPVRPARAGQARTGDPAPQPPPELGLRCDSDCPDAVGMVVFPGPEEGERCTASLITPNQMVTASHCLPADRRRPGASCADAWIGFPGRPAEWVRCDEVVRAHMTDDEQALRTDVAILRLESLVERTPLVVDRTTLPIGDVVTVTSVTPHRVYRSQHFVDSQHCRVHSSDRAEEYFGPDAALVGWLGDCPIERGNSGSPVLDRDGRLRAVVHGGSHPFFGIGVMSSL
ncbi:MAG: trypsin-like peptidase domain-containing protein [Myxococcota bacterium]